VSNFDFIKSQVETNLALIRAKQVPQSWLFLNKTGFQHEFSDEQFEMTTFCFRIRELVIRDLGFCMIATDWIRPLAKWIGNRNCLEVMAGVGAFSYALQREGVKIHATSLDDGSFKQFRKDDWCEVENIDASEAIRKYQPEIVVMSWPSYKCNAATKVVETIREVNPNILLLYVGEGKGGCCADDDFFENVKKVEDARFLQAVESYTTFWSIHDKPYLLQVR